MDYLRLYEGAPYQVMRYMPVGLRSVAGRLARTVIRKENQREVMRRAAVGQELFWGNTTFKSNQLEKMLSDAFSRCL